MSLVQRSVTIFQRFLRSRRTNAPKYGTAVQKMATKTEDNIVWIDMEMTGLDIDKCHILEVACLITDANLNLVSQDFNMIIHQSDDVLNSMNEWCIEQHGKTGLTDASRNSKISLESAEKELLEFVKNHVPKGTCPLAGNTIYMDRMFLAKYMPTVNDYLHYRIIDTSSIKEVTRRWNPEIYTSVPTKNCTHRAIDDIRESLNELKFYRNNIFNRVNCK